MSYCDHNLSLRKIENNVTMSLSDTVEILWKTNCKWHDHPHWPKRKDLKLKDAQKGNGKRWPLLAPGDAVRVKFGTRWYDGEVQETWKPKSWKGIAINITFFKKERTLFKDWELTHYLFLFYLETSSISSNATAPDNCEVSIEPQQQPTVEPQAEQATVSASERHPHEVFLEWQRAREAHLEVNRNREDQKKRTEAELQKQLEAKDKQCHKLKEEVHRLKTSNECLAKQLAASTEQVSSLDSLRAYGIDFHRKYSSMILSQIIFILGAFQDSGSLSRTDLAAMESRMTTILAGVMDRLENLESAIALNAGTIQKSPAEFQPFIDETEPQQTVQETTADDLEPNLTTIDMATLDTICGKQPDNPIVIATSTPTPAERHEQPVQHVPESLLRSCVTPRKLEAVRDTLQREKQRNRCATKLLQYFFTSEELSKCNTGGTHNKPALNSTKLNSLKGMYTNAAETCPSRLCSLNIFLVSFFPCLQLWYFQDSPWLQVKASTKHGEKLKEG